MGVKDGFDFTKAALGGVGAGWGMINQGWGGLTHRMAAERKTYENYANVSKHYGEAEAIRRYGKIMRPGKLQAWAWLGLGSSVAPLGWRRYRPLTKEEMQAKEVQDQKVQEAKDSEQPTGGAVAQPTATPGFARTAEQLIEDRNRPSVSPEEAEGGKPPDE